MTTESQRNPAQPGRWRAVVMAAALIAMSVVLPPAQAATAIGDYADSFSLIWYGHSSGSLQWEPDWVESGDDTSAWTGAFRIGTDPHCVGFLCLIIGKDGVDDASIQRSADLSAADSALLSFQRKRHQHAGAAGLVRLSVSSTGTGSWAALDQWTLDTTDSAAVDEQYDITPWISGSTTIRFELVGGSDQSHLNVDNLKIELLGEDNLDPILAPILDQTIPEEVPFAFSASATDPNDGDVLTFALDGTEPAGAAITPSGDFTWTPTEAQGPGAYSFDVIVSDNGSPQLSDSQTLTLTVEESNAPPTLGPVGNRFVDEGSTLSFAATGTDPETAVGELTFSLFGAVPPGAAITDAGVFAWTPTEAQGPGAYTFEVKIWDDGSPALYDAETITVTVNEVNGAPSLAAIPDQNVDEGVELTFAAIATDTDLPANNLDYALAGAPAGASISSGGVFSWTPTDLQGPGSFTFDVVVMDDGSPVRTASETVTVTVAEANIAPVVNPVTPRSVAEGGTLQFAVTASDADSPANSFVFSLEGAPADATISPSGTFSWSPDEADGPGVYRFDVVATDDGIPAMTGVAEIKITVTEVNTAPVLTTIASQTISEGALFTLQASATDLDYPANTLTFSVEGPPTGLSITPSGLLSWTPSEAQGPGTHVFDVVVTDNGSPARSDRQQVTITVTDANNAPYIDPIGTVAATEGEPVTFVVSATDPDEPADTFWFRLAGETPTGASITSSGAFSWIPAEIHGPGSYTFDVVVTDTGVPARSSSAQVTVVVAEANQAPQLELMDEYSVEGGSPYLLAAVATDADLPAQSLRFSASGLPPGAEFSPNGMLTWQPGEDNVGDRHSVAVTVTDDGVPALSTTVTTELVVVASNLAPDLAPLEDWVVGAGEMVSFMAEATDADGSADELVFSLAPGAPPGAAIDANSGVFEWRPTNAQDHASYKITVRVTDGGVFPKSDAEGFTVTVGRPNQPPEVASLEEQRSMPREIVNLAIHATDPDGYPEPLSFAAKNLPPGLEIDPVRGVISGEPGFDGLATSPYLVEILVSDGRDTTTVTVSWAIAGSANPTSVTPTRRAVVNRVNEAATPTIVSASAEGNISRSLVVMASAVRSGVTEMSLPLLYLLVVAGAIMALGRIGIVPVLRRGSRNEGVLVHFDSAAGSGLVVRKSDAAEVFVHSSAIARRERSQLLPGDAVEFRTVDGAYRDVITRLRKRR